MNHDILCAANGRLRDSFTIKKEEKLMKRKYSQEAMDKLNLAIRKNDLFSVKRLIESGDAVVTNVDFAGVVHANCKEILEYFLEKVTDAVAVISFGLDIAIRDKNLEFVKMIVQTLKDNKSRKYSHQNVDSVIAMAIYQVGQYYNNRILNEEEMFKYTKTILGIYCT